MKPAPRLTPRILALMNLIRDETAAITRAGKTADLLSDKVAHTTLLHAEHDLLWGDPTPLTETLRDALGTLRGFRRTHSI